MESPLDVWWRTLVNEQPPTEETIALWFGLFEGERGTMLYVQGYADFDPLDETAEWAADRPSWAPDSRYIRVEEIAGADDWETALAAAVRLVADLQPWSSSPVRLDGVGVGFDDGNPHLVWIRAA
jgi:hypothetical protein